MVVENPGDTTNASLLVRVRNPKDGGAWREFENRYAELVRRYCHRRRLVAADVDDVSQMVWGDLAKGLRNFAYDPARGRFRAYLGQIVRNAISRHFSRYRLNVRPLDSAVLASCEDNSDDAGECWEKEWVDHHYRLALQTIERTFEEKSVAVFGQLISGKPTERVAEEYGMTMAAVKQAKHRIRVRMKELIAQQIREEDEPDTFKKE